MLRKMTMSHLGRFIFRNKTQLPWSRLFIFKSQTRALNTSRIASKEYKTMNDVRESLERTLKSHPTESKISMKRKMDSLPKSQSELPVRKMKDSFDTAIVPLKSDFELRNKYATFMHEVRLGRLMEDLDMFAVWCSAKHLLGPEATSDATLPYSIVTIRVDDMVLTDRPTPKTLPHPGEYRFENGTSHHNLSSTEANGKLYSPQNDIRVSGHVSWVGKSSMEVIIWMDQEVNGKWTQITKAFILMAARNPLGTGPGIVNPLQPETPEEKELYEGGEQRKLWRLKMMNESLLKKVPTQEELTLIHRLFTQTMDSKDLFLDKRVLPPNGRWMHEATLNNMVLCHPEHRNLHNKVFGGFLIRQAVELGWVIGYTYGKKIPRLIHISDIGFYSPVDVGSLLKLYGSVTYSEGDYVQVFVYAEAYNTQEHQGKSTTGFNFTYKLPNTTEVLYPHSYLEAMKYVDGRRHLLRVKNFQEKNR